MKKAYATRIEETVIEAFKKKCEQKGLKQAQVLEALMQYWASCDEIEIEVGARVKV